MTAPTRVLCNQPPFSPRKHVIRLRYDREAGQARNVRLALPQFVSAVYHLPDHILDLLELAAFTYVADRLVPRGPKDALEYHSWGRHIEFHQRVRVPELWSQPALKNTIRQSLEWLTGDQSITHTFYEGHRTPPSGLFDSSAFSVEPPINGLAVLPFSGGLDSLAGALWLLERSTKNVCLVSHQSQSKTKKTQNGLAEALQRRYPERVAHYKFECGIAGTRAPEESQRSRSFMYCSIAFAIAASYSQREIFVFENGVTSLNIGRRQDMLNARSSRTTHPQTLGRLAEVFSLVGEAPFTIEAPFLWKTKRDILELIAELGGSDLIPSAVSCTRTMQYTGVAPQCGECFQCVDRRVAAYASNLHGVDYAGLYHNDIIREPVGSSEAKTTVVDYVRQARAFARLSPDAFHDEYLSDIADVLDWISAGSDSECVEAVQSLASRHGRDVQLGLKTMQMEADPFEPAQHGSMLQLVQSGEHAKPEVIRLVTSISHVLRTAVPGMFRRNPPENEPDFNRKIGALLSTHHEELLSEHPLPRFACSGVVVDHSLPNTDLVIESKYIRDGTSPSKASEALLVDLIKYPDSVHVLAVILDLGGAIVNDDSFTRDIERGRGNCSVLILR